MRLQGKRARNDERDALFREQLQDFSKQAFLDRVESRRTRGTDRQQFLFLAGFVVIFAVLHSGLDGKLLMTVVATLLCK
jgi:hypothetical protein